MVMEAVVVMVVANKENTRTRDVRYARKDGTKTSQIKIPVLNVPLEDVKSTCPEVNHMEHTAHSTTR